MIEITEKTLVYSILVVIVREGVPELTGFREGEEREAEEYFEKVSMNWSDSFLCRVERGPRV